LQDVDEWLPFLVAMATPARARIRRWLPDTCSSSDLLLRLIRPMKSPPAEGAGLLDGLKVGDRVVTSAGSTAASPRVEKDRLQLQIADKVRVDISRNAIVGYQDQEPVGAEGPARWRLAHVAPGVPSERRRG
jgi:preprotein translocase subunit YajC